MRSTTYGNLVNGLSAIAGINPTNILTHEKALIAEYLTDATRFAYDYYPWPELLITEQRALREDWAESGTYSIGSEVYHDGKYYRAYHDLSLGTAPTPVSPDLDLLSWYEIGDTYEDDPWDEGLVYHIGARVKYNDKVYLCVEQLAGSSASGVLGVNYQWDKITPVDTTYWKEIDVSFDRYLPYEVEGYNTIGTFISAHLTDPRYSNAQTLNWREGAEGIYLEKLDNFPNKVWVKYRVEAPEYTSDTADETLVSRSLAPAIKTHAYKSWLIGDGQHEKSELQDIRFMDMLVREIDKLNGQQDRAVPFQVQSEPYRRVNARVDYIVEKTFDKIHQIHNAYSNPRIKFGTTSIGKQSVKRGSAKPNISLEAFSNGLNIVRKGRTLVTPKVWTFVSGNQAIKKGTSYSSFKIFTGTPHRSIAIGFIKGEAGIFAKADLGFSLSSSVSGSVEATRNASINFSVTTSADGVQAIKNATTSIDLNLVSSVNAKTAILNAQANINFSISSSVLGKQAIVSGATDSTFTIITSVDAGKNKIHEGGASSDISFSTNVGGEVDQGNWVDSNSNWVDSNQIWG